MTSRSPTSAASSPANISSKDATKQSIGNADAACAKAAADPLTQDFLSFLHSSPSQFHCTASAVERLTQAGFIQLRESDDFAMKLQAGKRYFYTRNQSSLVAFALPHDYVASGNSINQFLVVAGHTDSPVLKLKPITKLTKSGYLQVAVECYGGGLFHTWFDRDLSIAGRVILKTESGFEVRLVHIKRPVLRVPTLAIHLSRDTADKGFAPNKQTHLLPILASELAQQLNDPVPTKASAAEKDSNKSAAAPLNSFADSHHTVLLQLLCNELNLNDPTLIRDFELSLYDTQVAQLGGLYNEFILSRALDNQCMSFVALRSLIDSTNESNWSSQVASKSASASGVAAAKPHGIRCVALFDNEEVGSVSEHGAGSNLLMQFFTRVNNNPSTLDGAIRRSLLISADMAHGVHPNYSEAHEELHRPAMSKGLVIKENGNQRYATTQLLQFMLTELATRHGIAIQQFVVRNDTGCGSTIGPTLSAACGLRTIDVGIPQLSMHSIREMCAAADLSQAHSLFVHAFNEFHTLDQSIRFEGGEQ